MIDFNNVEISNVIQFFWYSSVFVAPVLIIDMWFKQKEVNDQLNEIQELINELNEDE